MRKSFIDTVKDVSGLHAAERSVVGNKSLLLNNIEKVARASKLLSDEGVNWDVIMAITGEIYSPIGHLFNLIDLNNEKFVGVRSYKNIKKQKERERVKEIRRKKKEEKELEE